MTGSGAKPTPTMEDAITTMAGQIEKLVTTVATIQANQETLQGDQSHQHGVSSIAPPVDGRLVWALPESHPLERGVQLGIPRPRCLPQAIEALRKRNTLPSLPEIANPDG
jgi:hypothetical protein